MIYRGLVSKNLELSFQLKKERLRESINWVPFPIIISFYLVTILGAQLLTDLNPRLGARVKPIRYYSAEKANPVIWVGIYADKSKINLVTSERVKYSVPRSDYNVKGLKDFIEHLKKIQMHHYESMGRSLDSVENRSRIAISVDRDLIFKDLKPLIYAFAEAGISNYEFETQLIK